MYTVVNRQVTEKEREMGRQTLKSVLKSVLRKTKIPLSYSLRGITLSGL